MKIISGGQTGADQGGLNAAIKLDLEHGGWCPLGRKSERGPIPAKYDLQETASSGYLERTERNIIDSDATLIFVGGMRLTGGSRTTRKFCIAHLKPSLVIAANCAPLTENIQLVREFLDEHKPEVLNIAGNRSSKEPGIEVTVEHILTKALSERGGQPSTQVRAPERL